MGTFTQTDSAAVPHPMETAIGDAGGSAEIARVALRAAVETNLATAATQLTAIAGSVDGLEGFTDGIETLLGTLSTALTALQGYVDGLEALVGTTNTTLSTTNTTLSTLDGHVDGLEGFTDGIETKLDTLHTDLGTVATNQGPPSAVFNGTKDVTTAGTRVTLAGSQTLTEGVWIRAKDGNTGTIYVGSSTVASSNGHRLLAKDAIFIRIANLTTINLDSSVNGEGVTYFGW